MKIVVNAIQLRVAGGRSVATNFLRCCRDSPRGHEVVAYAPPGLGYEELEGGRLRVHPVPAHFARTPLRLWVDYVWWRRTLQQESPDALFTMGSVAVPTRGPQLVLFHWPYAIYDDDEVWSRMDARSAASRRVRRALFRSSLRYATCIAAQTATARERLIRGYRTPDVRVVPNAVSLPDDAGGDVAFELPTGGRNLICLSRYYPHKNLESLLPLARLVRERGAPYRFFTTFSPDDHPAAAKLLEDVEREGLGEIWVNLGPVSMQQVPALYRASDGLILPTVLESFSGTYVEAMFFERPVFTSDRDFARDVCGDVAHYFDPHSAEDMLRSLDEAFGDDAGRKARIAEGRERCRSYPTWSEVADTYLGLLEEVAGGAG